MPGTSSFELCKIMANFVKRNDLDIREKDLLVKNDLLSEEPKQYCACTKGVKFILEVAKSPCLKYCCSVKRSLSVGNSMSTCQMMVERSISRLLKAYLLQ